jgi:tripartite-type tricarboxylate transporter receptor subunit TctC
MNDLTRRGAVGAIASALALAALPDARAQAWPAKPMRSLVPYPVGGIVDIVTRALADPLQVDLGQPVVVEPKPGANSTLATAMIPQAPADGYTWVMSIETSGDAPAMAACWVKRTQSELRRLLHRNIGRRSSF